MKIGLFTIASKNYLAYVRVLLDSVAQVHPEYRRYLCLADLEDGYFDSDAEPYNVVRTDQLGIPNFKDMTLRYDIMEFNTAVKPFMFRWLFDHTDLDAVIYLDPDIRVYSRFDHLESVLCKGASVVLTPHITRPLEDGKSPNDYHMLQAGVFNLGFIAARRCRETLEFVDWWGRKLTSQCNADFKTNLFVDQKWCDLAPCFLNGLKVFKDAGYNVAYWNLAQREVAQTATGEWQVNDSPLAFYHFSGVSPDKRRMVSKHQNRFEWDDIPECQTLFEGYLDELVAHGWKEIRKWPYAYGSVSERFRLGTLVRQLYRSVVPEPIALDELDIEKYLVDLCNQPADGNSDEGNTRITRLMSLVYQMRPDVQAAFDLTAPDGRCQFARWFEVAGEHEYDLPRSVTHQGHIQVSKHTSEGSKEKAARWCYRALAAVQAPAQKIAQHLPATMREKGMHFWFRVKAIILRAL